MATLRTFIVSGLAAVACSACVLPTSDASLAALAPTRVEPAQAVDIDAYLGRWYELARYDVGGQQGCDRVTVDYSRRPDGLIRVLNSCSQPGNVNQQRVTEGRARVVDEATRARLRVSYFGPFWNNYWILDHAPDYRWAIVGEPSRRYLWLLHRSPQPAEADYATMVERAQALGYDTARLRRTIQGDSDSDIRRRPPR